MNINMVENLSEKSTQTSFLLVEVGKCPTECPSGGFQLQKINLKNQGMALVHHPRTHHPTAFVETAKMG